MRCRAVAGLVLVLSLLSVRPLRADEPEKKDAALGDKVVTAVRRGVKYLREQEDGRGKLEKSVVLGQYPGGMTALATLALLEAGVPPDDPLIERCLEYLRTIAPNDDGQTYVVALQTMVYAAAGRDEDRKRIQSNVDWLLAARVMRGAELGGWTYGKKNGVPDGSNTQYAVLALHEGFRAGAKIDPAVWEAIRDHYLKTQQDRGDDRGGWHYRQGGGATLTMTTAGLCGLLIATTDLKAARQKGEADCKGEHCGEHEEDKSVGLALEWIGKHLPRKPGDMHGTEHLYYSLYGIERAGRLSGECFLGDTDWYRAGCEYLVDHQRPDGSWAGQDIEGVPVHATSFALLFLTKGRTPVLVSKLVHGPGADPGSDWNVHRNDARNLVAFASNELFKKQPLAWQVFDTRRHGGDPAEQRPEELTAELLESPVAYVSGTQPPRFTAAEEQMLRQYVLRGGFLYAEAACGQEAFDKGFRDLVQRLFPNNPLKPLSPEHPIWEGPKFKVSPKDHPLWGIKVNGRTAVVYSPEGLSCWWEHNQFEQGKGREAFRLGANIIAHATEMELPRPRLSGTGDAGSKDGK
jgi:hypothetical protein